MASSRQMMSLAAWSVSHHIGPPRHMRPVGRYSPVRSPHHCSRAWKWPAGPVLHYSGMFARLVGHNNVACPHVLQASTALASVPWKHTNVPWKHASMP
jgi:hypothetical protein